MRKWIWLGLAMALGAPAGMALAQAAPARHPPAPELSAMDGNGDGRVTVAEADAFFARMPQGHGDKGEPPAGKAPPEGKAPPRPAAGQGGQPPAGQSPRPPRAVHLDRNGDGLISQAEFAAMLRAMPPRPAR